MKGLLTVVVIATIAGRIGAIVPPTNSAKETSHAIDRYAAGDLTAAAEAAARAMELDPSVEAGFNAGTTEIAAGERERGIALLERALDDPRLAPLANYNRGNGYLLAGKYDEAIAAYAAALRAKPDLAAAKRNLEIALQRRQEQQEGDSGGSGDQDEQQEGSPEPSAEDDEAPSPAEEISERELLEAMLRAVQQQEREELERMRRHGPRERRVGW